MVNVMSQKSHYFILKVHERFEGFNVILVLFTFLLRGGGFEINWIKLKLAGLARWSLVDDYTARSDVMLKSDCINTALNNRPLHHSSSPFNSQSCTITLGHCDPHFIFIIIFSVNFIPTIIVVHFHNHPLIIIIKR